MSFELLRGREDKILSEVDSRFIGESWRERDGTAKLYCGALLVAKAIPSKLRTELLARNCKPGYSRLATGSQQIVTYETERPTTVIKVDKDSLSLPREAMNDRASEVKRMTDATYEIVGGCYIPGSEIAVTHNPLLFGPENVVATHQVRVFGGQDVFKLSAGEYDELTDETKEGLAELVDRVQHALDARNPLVPELIGRGNLVVGHLGDNVEGVWLLDTLATSRDELETRCGPVADIPNIEVYSKRLASLGQLASAYSK